MHPSLYDSVLLCQIGISPVEFKRVETAQLERDIEDDSNNMPGMQRLD